MLKAMKRLRLPIAVVSFLGLVMFVLATMQETY